jgi:hypothetical protein
LGVACPFVPTPSAPLALMDGPRELLISAPAEIYPEIVRPTSGDRDGDHSRLRRSRA